MCRDMTSVVTKLIERLPDFSENIGNCTDDERAATAIDIARWAEARKMYVTLGDRKIRATLAGLKVGDPEKHEDMRRRLNSIRKSEQRK